VSMITDHPVVLFIAAILLLWITAMILIRRSDKIKQERARIRLQMEERIDKIVSRRPRRNTADRSVPSHLPTSHRNQYNDSPTFRVGFGGIVDTPSFPSANGSGRGNDSDD
jgi:hypothetical protein